MSQFLSMTARRIVAPAAVAAASLLRVSPMRAEEAAVVAEEEDPYANLPKEDERTLCQVCLINRQGPCRPYWRKMEACLKDHDGEKKQAQGQKQHSSVVCDRYMIPWLDCVQSYRNMYMLYYNDLYQLEVIEPIEKEIQPEELYKWEEVELDWTPYIDWIKSKDVPLWRLFSGPEFRVVRKTPRPVYEGKDPELVKLEIKVKLEKGGLPIELAYAKDQGGLVLGYEQFTAAKKDNLDVGVLEFGFRPDRTASVQLFALYKGEGEEARLYLSEALSLLKVADNAKKQEGETDL
jgi:hypothetical protein